MIGTLVVDASVRVDTPNGKRYGVVKGFSDVNGTVKVKLDSGFTRNYSSINVTVLPKRT